MMNPNAGPYEPLRKSWFSTVTFASAALGFLWLGTSVRTTLMLQFLCLTAAAGFALFLVFFEVQSVEFFPTYLSINYILRKRLVDHADIEFVSLETGSNRGVTYHYVQMRLRDGMKIKLSGFKEDVEDVYERIKACESSNEEFLRSS